MASAVLVRIASGSPPAPTSGDTAPTMSKENVESLRRAWEASQTQNWPALLEELHPEVEVHDFDIPDAGIYHGHDGYLRWLAAWNDAWADWRAEDLEILDVDDERTISTFRLIAKGSSSGIEIERLDAIVNHFREGKIVRAEYFNDQRAGLKAVGLSE